MSNMFHIHFNFKPRTTSFHFLWNYNKNSFCYCCGKLDQEMALLNLTGLRRLWIILLCSAIFRLVAECYRIMKFCGITCFSLFFLILANALRKKGENFVSHDIFFKLNLVFTLRFILCNSFSAYLIILRLKYCYMFFIKFQHNKIRFLDNGSWIFLFYSFSISLGVLVLTFPSDRLKFVQIMCVFICWCIWFLLYQD